MKQIVYWLLIRKKKTRFLRNAIRVIGIRFLCFGYKILYVHSPYLISRRNLFKSTTPNPILILASDADGNSTIKENMLSWHKCCFDEKCLHKLKPIFHVTWCVMSHDAWMPRSIAHILFTIYSFPRDRPHICDCWFQERSLNAERVKTNPLI